MLETQFIFAYTKLLSYDESNNMAMIEADWWMRRLEKQKKEEKAENENGGGEDLNAIASKFTAMQKLGKVGEKKADNKVPREKRPDQRVRERREKQAETVRKEALVRKEAGKMGKKRL